MQRQRAYSILSQSPSYGATRQSLFAEEQPDVAAHGPLIAVEVADEKVELAVLVPVGDVEARSVTFAEVAAGQTEQLSRFQFGLSLSPRIDGRD